MRKFTKKTLSLALALVLALGCCTAAFAAVYTVSGKVPQEVTGKKQIENMVSFFNGSVNVIKTETPKATVKYHNYLPKGGLVTGSGGDAEELDENAQKYLLPVLEGLFNGRSSLTKSFIQTLLGSDQGNTLEQLELHRGQLRNHTVPVYGKPYVSALVPAQDFDLYADYTKGGKTPSRMSLSFKKQTLEEAKASSMAKVFSLPSGDFDPTIFSGTRTEYVSRLDNAKFTSFDIEDAKIVTQYDDKGRLSYYGSTIEYHFSISFYDCMNLISAVLGYDFYGAVIDAVNPILEKVSKDDISKESVLQEHQVYVTYCCDVEITKLDYSSRLFGDIDDNGAVTAEDARIALRHAVDLEPIYGSDDRIYADIDFNGVINAEDARLILRTSVELEKPFKDVPADKKIKIVKIEEEPPLPAQPEDDETPANGDPSGLLKDYDPAITMADVVKEVLSFIGSVEDEEGGARGAITDYIKSIQDAVKDARGDNEP